MRRREDARLIPTQADVARAAGVSRALVSMALSGSTEVAEETRTRILLIADELGYTRNLGAASLATQSSPIIGVVLPDMRNPFFESLVEAIQNQAEVSGLTPLVGVSANDPDREEAIIRRFRELRAVGLIAVSPVRGAEALRETGDQIAFVILAAPPAGGRVDTVHVDEDAAAALVMRHLRERNWRRVVHLPDEQSGRRAWDEPRRDALRRGAQQAGLPFVTVPEGAPAAEVLTAGGPIRPEDRVAVVAHNDLQALDVVAAVRSAGLRPGHDVAVVGFDDTYLARRTEFDITSVRQSPADFAAYAFSAVERRLASPELDGVVRLVTPTLSVRSSS